MAIDGLNFFNYTFYIADILQPLLKRYLLTSLYPSIEGLSDCFGAEEWESDAAYTT